MGVTVETIRPGDNKTYPKPGDTVTMDYTGKFLDGTVRTTQDFKNLGPLCSCDV